MILYASDYMHNMETILVIIHSFVEWPFKNLKKLKLVLPQLFINTNIVITVVYMTSDWHAHDAARQTRVSQSFVQTLSWTQNDLVVGFFFIQHLSEGDTSQGCTAHHQMSDTQSFRTPRLSEARGAKCQHRKAE